METRIMTNTNGREIVYGAPIFLKSNLISQVPYIQLMYSVSLVNA